MKPASVPSPAPLPSSPPPLTLPLVSRPPLAGPPSTPPVAVLLHALPLPPPARASLEGEGCSMFLLTMIRPVSILSSTSHHDGRSRKAGLHTPAMKPGLGGERSARAPIDEQTPPTPLADCRGYSNWCRGRPAARYLRGSRHIHYRARRQPAPARRPCLQLVGGRERRRACA